MKAILNILLVVGAVGFFFFLKLSGIIPIIATIGVAFAIHLVAGKFLDNKEEKKIIETIKEDDEKPKIKLPLSQIVNDLAEDFYGDSVDQFGDCVESFSKKQMALMQIIKLTGENSEYIKNASDDAEDYLRALAKRLRIKLTALGALDENDYQYEETQDEIDSLISKTRELLKVYSSLLTEASKVNDDEGTDDTQLKNAIAKLKSVREENSEIFEDVSSKGLFVTSSGSNLGI